MRSIRTILVPLALLVVLAPTAAPAQDQPRSQFGEELDVSEVLLDVLVTDRQGNVILGLGPDDFVVDEDGQERQITGVSFYSNRRLAGPVPTALEGEIQIETLPDDRYFILFFDDQRQAQFDTDVPVLRQQMDAARFAKQWVREELLPNDWVAVVSYDQRLKVQCDLTRNRSAIIDAIDDAVRGKDAGLNWPSRAPAQDAGPSVVDDLPTGDALRKATLRVYDAVELVAQSVGDIRARKNLVLFTTGFGQINSVGQYLEDPRYYPPMMQTLNDNNVAVYTVDLTPNTTKHVMSDGMNQLADETGGRYFFNFTSFLTPLGQIADENNGYYLLSYRSAHPRGETGFQNVRVRTVNSEFQVKTRKGYAYGSGEANGLSATPRSAR